MAGRWSSSGGRWAAVAVLALAAPALAGCTQDPVDPQRARTVVVAVDSPFTSLNAGLPEGRTSGSTLVRGLVSDRLVGLDESGAAVPDEAVGTVEKVADDPLTVRYTIADGARWSDGTPVTPADLLLEWAARSGRFDEAAPADDEPTDGASATPSASLSAAPSAPASPSPSPTPSGSSSPTPSGAADDSGDGAVRFGAASPALIAASATPTIDGSTLTVVYDHPVADWQVALDVDLPAHVVGRLAFGGATPRATGAATPSATGSATPATGTAWADEVVDAIVHADRAALARVSQVWRTGWGAAELAADPDRAVTTGPYRITAVDPAGRVELARNDEYRGSRPGGHDRVVVRWNLDPLAAVDALRDGDVDVVAPVSTPDVTAALDRVRDVRVATGGGAVLQLVLNEAAGPFSPGSYDGDGAAASAAAVRAAFVAAVPRGELASAAGAEPSDALLATAGPGRTTSVPEPTGTAGLPAGGTAPVPVRVLAATGDPARAAMLDALTAAASAAGFAVTAATPDDAASALWSEPDAWDAALVPVSQDELPALGTAERWRTGGATNVTGHADADLDAVLDALTRTADPAAASGLLDRAATAVLGADAAVPLARQPSVAATVDRPDGSPLPDVGAVPAVPWGDTDLSGWWSWAAAPAPAPTGTGTSAAGR